MNPLNEARFEDVVFDTLGNTPQYQKHVGLTQFDFETQIWQEELVHFIKTTQADEWRKLSRQFPNKETEALCQELAKLRQRRGILDLIRNGFTLRGVNIRLVYFRPSSGMNPEHQKKYAHGGAQHDCDSHQEHFMLFKEREVPKKIGRYKNGQHERRITG